MIIPAFNEAQSILDIVKAACRQSVDSVVVIDDGSTDATSRIIQDIIVGGAANPVLKLLRHPSNLGKGFALASGIDCALVLGAERVITIDADGQHNVNDIPRLEHVAMTDPNAIVIAARAESREQAPRLRRFANAVADFWISWACGCRIQDTQSGFRLYPAAALKRLSARPRRNEGFVFETELLIDCVVTGAAVLTVPILTRYQAGLRPSHYRPWRDTWSIVRLVGVTLLRRRMYPMGLLRSLGWSMRIARDKTIAVRDMD